MGEASATKKNMDTKVTPEESVEKFTKGFILKRIYELPEAIGVGVGLSLLSIGAPYFVLEILAPNYEINFNSIFPRWAVICVVLTVIYYWRKAWNVKKQ